MKLIDCIKLLKTICINWNKIPWYGRLSLRFRLFYSHWFLDEASPWPIERPPQVFVTPNRIHPYIEAFAQYYINKKWPALMLQPSKSQIRFFGNYDLTSFAILSTLPPTQSIHIYIAHALATTI